MTFDEVPSNLRAPFVAVEINNSQANQGPALQSYRALLIGQKLGSSSGLAADSLARVTSKEVAASKCGRGSQLARMAAAWFSQNQSTELWLGVLDDAITGVLASGLLAFTGPATADGVLYLYVGGQRIPVAVSNGDTASAIAANAAAAIGKHAAGTVTLASAIAAETVTIGATVFTAASGVVIPGAATFSIDTSDAAAAASLASQVKAHAVAGRLVRASPSAGVVSLHAIQGGTGGNAIALAKTASGSHIVVSGAALAGATAETDYAAFADVAGANVTVYAKNAGAVANELDLRVNYNDGEQLPAGVGLVITAMASGASNPSLTNLIAAMGDTQFNVIAEPYTDATNLTALETELHSRFGPMRMIDGVAIYSSAVDYTTVATLGESRNSQHMSLVRTGGYPTPPEECSAAVAGAVAFEGAKDPGRPLQTVALPWILPPAEHDKDTLTERNLLYFDGVSSLKDNFGTVQIDRLITTYQKNSVGASDPSYLNLETMNNLSYLRYSFRVQFGQKYPRHKLGQDGQKYGAGQPVLTPSGAKAEAVIWFGQMLDLALVQDLATFKANVTAEQDAQNPDRLNIYLPPKIINQLINTAAQIAFQR